MADLDAFAARTAVLNPFLFAGVGQQTNGAELTILSLLARLGSDPWAEAARLAALPRGAAADWLAERIGAMPLTAAALGDARTTATRLVQLLPAQTPLRAAITDAGSRADRMPLWAIVALLLGLLALGLAVTSLRGSAQPGEAPAASQQDR